MNLTKDPNCPFSILYPEYNLITYYEIRSVTDIHFRVLHPDYIEDPQFSSMPNYLWMVRNGKLGILYYQNKRPFTLPYHIKYKRLIPCRYDHIEKLSEEGHPRFRCHKGEEVFYYDSLGRPIW